MKIWGIGANWGGKSMLSEFQSKSAVGIGWSEENAPALYAMMSEIEMGDLIYVKSFVIRGSILKIKAVGEVENVAFSKPNVFGDNHKTVKVRWKAGSFCQVISHTITPAERKYNVYGNTLYREYNPSIISEIIDY